MSQEPLAPRCPQCNGPLLPVLIQVPTTNPSGPLSADIPVVLDCPDCTAVTRREGSS